MAVPLNRRLIARDILANPSHEGAEILIEQLSMPQETNEYQTALALFNFCYANFPNCLILKLLKVYRYSSSGFLRTRSINLLSGILAYFKTCGLELSAVAHHEIRPLLISCLRMEETKESDMTVLGIIVSHILYYAVICDDNGWHELSDCILWLANKAPLKAFYVFIDLPPVYGTFIYNFMQIIVEKAEKVLLNPGQSGVEFWSLAFETVVKMGIQLLDTMTMRYDLIKNLSNILVKSIKELLEKRMEPFLLRGLEHLERFLSRDKNMYNYNKDQCAFVMSFLFLNKDFRSETKEIVKKISQLVRTQEYPTSNVSLSVIKPQENQDDGAKYDHGWYDQWKTLSSVDILAIFASDFYDLRSREVAIRRLEVVLSDHTSKKVEIDLSELRRLQPVLIYCLNQEGITDSMFKVLGEVVNQVLCEMFKHQEVAWYALRDYIASKSKTEFDRVVYIFQCLTMPLEDDEFVIYVMKNLLPEIRTRLNPPRKVLVDNSCWVLAFTGAFCATIHLIEIISHAEAFKETAIKMIDSARELVERGMEVVLVRRAFMNMESIVKKQLEWYGTKEYKLVKCLICCLYAIKGMKWESKIVLWRINVMIVERQNNEKV